MPIPPQTSTSGKNTDAYRKEVMTQRFNAEVYLLNELMQRLNKARNTGGLIEAQSWQYYSARLARLNSPNIASYLYFIWQLATTEFTEQQQIKFAETLDLDKATFTYYYPWIRQTHLAKILNWHKPSKKVLGKRKNRGFEQERRIILDLIDIDLLKVKKVSINKSPKKIIYPEESLLHIVRQYLDITSGEIEVEEESFSSEQSSFADPERNLDLTRPKPTPEKSKYQHKKDIPRFLPIDV